MGSLIAAPPWLLELAQRGEKQRRVAARLITTCTVVEKRTGHSLDIGHYQARRAIFHSAAWGHVARTPVRCIYCNATANLTDWDLVAHMSKDEHRSLAATASVSWRPHDYLYIQRCAGAEMAAYLAASEQPPEDR